MNLHSDTLNSIKHEMWIKRQLEMFLFIDHWAVNCLMKALAQKIHQNLSYGFRALELLILSRWCVSSDFLPWKSSPRPTESPTNARNSSFLNPSNQINPFHLQTRQFTTTIVDEQLGPGLCSCESRVLFRMDDQWSSLISQRWIANN